MVKFPGIPKRTRSKENLEEGTKLKKETTKKTQRSYKSINKTKEVEQE
jgi:hypothetical protein